MPTKKQNMNEEELADAIALAKQDPNVLEISTEPRAIRTTYSTRFFESAEEFEEAIKLRASFGLEQVERATFGVQIDRAVTDAEESSHKGKPKSKYALKKARQLKERQTLQQPRPRQRAFGLEPPTEMPLAASLEEDRSVRPNRDERFPSAERARGTNPEYTHRRVRVSHLGINP